MLVVKKNQRQKSLNYWQKRQKDILSYLDRTDLDVFSELQ
ncbi:TPA: phage head morphogenesis protein, partial [Streptococcus equi subsp. equi]|nr:phage head morphogenesis protein [Streptococcus equi subsp. equi]